MKPSELLRLKGWTQDAYARDKNGNITDPDNWRATCFCALGAIRRCYSFDYEKMRVIASELLTQIELKGFRDEIPIWNDDPSRTVQEVIEMFEAIGQ